MTPPINVFAFNSLRNWRRVLRANPPVRRPYRAKLARMLATSAVGVPFAWWERWRYARQIENVRLHPEPLFIIGPARSGTTHLHNLLAQDPQFGYVSTLQSIAPNFVIGSGDLLRRLVERTLPETRPMDNVVISLDAPQEEEVALANTSPHSFLFHLLFPRRALHYFETYYLQKTITPAQLEEWRHDYRRVLQTATWLFKGRPLVLKTPLNSGRIPELLRMFPRARFIAIRRDPLRIVLSSRKMYRDILPPHQLQDFDWEEMDALSLRFLLTVQRKWETDRAQIAPQRLTIIRYEDLTQHPLETLTRAYAHLGLDASDALPRWEAYLDTLRDYRRNRYQASAADVRLAREKLRWLYETWKYPLPEEPQA